MTLDDVLADIDRVLEHFEGQRRTILPSMAADIVFRFYEVEEGSTMHWGAPGAKPVYSTGECTKCHLTADLLRDGVCGVCVP